MLKRMQVLCFVVVALVASSGWSQEKTTSSAWWPFSMASSTESKSSKPTYSPARPSKSTSEEDSWFQLPTWMKPKPKSKWEPSMSTKIRKTSKKWWDNTVDFLNPFNDAEDIPAPDNAKSRVPMLDGQRPNW